VEATLVDDNGKPVGNIHPLTEHLEVTSPPVATTLEGQLVVAWSSGSTVQVRLFDEQAQLIDRVEVPMLGETIAGPKLSILPSVDQRSLLIAYDARATSVDESEPDRVGVARLDCLREH